MSGLRAEVKTALAAAGLAPIHRLGQNFMVDAGAVGDVIEAALAEPVRRIVEVGPGTGILTSRLLAAGCEVRAVELDRGLAGLLEQQLVPQGLALTHGDALASKQQLHEAIVAFAAAGDWQLVSNLPYDVSIPVILNALALPRPPRQVVVTVQYEAAQRLCSQPGSKAWGASAAICAAAADAKILRRLGPQCFHPRPRVDSALLRLVPRAPLPPGYSVWCRGLFAYRRKLVGRALRDHGCDREAVSGLLEKAKVSPQERVENLTVDELVALHQACLEDE